MGAIELETAHTTKQKEIIERTEEFVRETLKADSTGHDWWHINRVRNVAVKLARAEGADPFIVELAALLHDIADWKFHGGDITAGATKSRQWLSSIGVDETTQARVAQIILTVSFKGAGVKNEVDTLEGQVVQDADRIDSLGAIGIARTFAYGGHFNRIMYDPEQKPVQHETFEQYKSSTGTTINHFYEKLLLLKDRLNTKAARDMAQNRHQFIEQFLEQFYDEWEGRK
ncbi:MAG: HD domain-containing protein [Candidatus Obscuribacterales bacterium]|nr:HD domain-containing protein [Cyanobacteria bacterium SZAS LIN-5]